MSASRIRIPQSLLSEHVETYGKPLCRLWLSGFRRAVLARKVGNARKVLEPMVPRSGLPGVPMQSVIPPTRPTPPFSWPKHAVWCGSGICRHFDP